MDWQEGVDKIIWQEIGSVYKTTDSLRLRSSEGTSGKSMLTLTSNTPVRVKGIGNLEKIDELIAFWLEVEIAEDSIDKEGNSVVKGTTGWLFGGYISMDKEAEYEEPIKADNTGTSEEEKEEDDDDTESYFPLIPIVVGVLCLCVIIAVAVTIKKKSKS